MNSQCYVELKKHAFFSSFNNSFIYCKRCFRLDKIVRGFVTNSASLKATRTCPWINTTFRTVTELSAIYALSTSFYRNKNN